MLLSDCPSPTSADFPGNLLNQTNGGESDLPTGACGELALRICGTARDGQTLRLRSRKCSIGGSSRCTLRLLAAGVRGVHCLIVRTATGTAVRSWSRDTRLNGRRFTDAALAVGDRLGIGSVELEVVSLGGNDQLSRGGPGDGLAAASQPDVAVEERILSAARQEFDAVRQQLATQQQSIADVQRTLANQTVELVAQLQQFVQQAPARDSQAEEVMAHAAALDRGLAELEVQRRELGQFGERVILEKAELEAERQAFAEEHARWHALQANDRAAPSDEDTATDRNDSEIFARLQRLANSASSHGQSPPADEGWPVDRPEAVAPAPSYREEPRGFADELANSPVAADPTANRRRGAPRPANESEEQSIEDYMQQLLHRVRGGSVPNREAPSAEPAVVGRADTPHAAEEANVPEPPVQARASMSLKDIAPRSLAPEKADMAAMRDLANSQARMALQTHQIQSTLRTVRGKWSIAAVGLAAAMFTLSFAPENSTMLRISAMMALLVALFWGFQAWMSTQKAKDATAMLQPIVAAPSAGSAAESTPAKAAGKSA